MSFRVRWVFHLFSIVFLGCSTLPASKSYYIRNRSILPVVFKLDGVQYKLKQGEVSKEIVLLKKQHSLSDVFFIVDLTKIATYRISFPSKQTARIEPADFISSKDNSAEKYYFDLWLPGQISIEKGKTSQKAPLPEDPGERLRFIRKAVRLISLRNNLENSKSTIELEGMIAPLSNYALSGFSEVPWEKELKKEFLYIEDKLWLALTRDALSMQKYEKAESYLNKYEEINEQRSEEENSSQYEKWPDYKVLRKKLDIIIEQRKHRVENYDKALTAVFRDFRIDAETRIWKYGKQYRNIVPFESFFLDEVLDRRKAEMPWFRFGVGLGIVDNFYLLHGHLAEDSQNSNQLRYHEQGPSLSLRFDFRLDNILLGVNVFGEARFSALMDGFVYSYYDNKNLVNNIGQQIRALNKVRYSPSAFAGFTAGLALSFEPRIRNHTIILRGGMGYNYTFIDDFEVYHEESGTWKSYDISAIKTFSLNGYFGYGFFINDLHKLEFFYNISAILPMEPFSTELPLWNELVQTIHSVQIVYIVFFN